MANIIEAFNDAFTEEYALAKIFVYAIPVFSCLYAYAIGQFVLSGFFGFFVVLLLFGLLTCGINGMRENKQEILTFNFQKLMTATVKSATIVVPQISIAVMIGIFIRELIPPATEITQIPVIINIIVWSILVSFITTSYLAFTKHMDVKEAYNMKLILESVVDVFVNLVFMLIQIVIANSIFIGLMSYVFTVLNLPLMHFGFVFYCSLLIIINISVMANILSQASYDCIKGSDEDYKDRYKIGSTLQTANFSGGIAITASGASPFIPGGITTTGTVSNNPPPQSRAAQSRNHLNKTTNRHTVNKPAQKPTINRSNINRNTPTGRSGGINRTTGGTVRGGTVNRNIGKGATGSNNAPKRTFGNSRRPNSGFGNNRNINRFGKKKNDGGGFFGFFKKK